MPDSISARLLVIGCGSIGERHDRTFLATGRTGIIACDPRSEIRAHIAEKYGVTASPDWEESLRSPSVTGAEH